MSTDDPADIDLTIKLRQPAHLEQGDLTTNTYVSRGFLFQLRFGVRRDLGYRRENKLVVFVRCCEKLNRHDYTVRGFLHIELPHYPGTDYSSPWRFNCEEANEDAGAQWDWRSFPLDVDFDELCDDLETDDDGALEIRVKLHVEEPHLTERLLDRHVPVPLYDGDEFEEILTDAGAERGTRTEREQGAGRPRVPTPQEIFNSLNEHVAGQESAKQALAVATYGHYRAIETSADNEMTSGNGEMARNEVTKQNLLFIGPPGSGKSLLAQTVARFLDVPFATCDCTALTPDNFEDNLSKMFDELERAAEYCAHSSGEGIVLLASLDKIKRISLPQVQGGQNFAELIQGLLLKIITGQLGPLNPSGNIYNAPEFALFDTTNVLFIGSGEFAGLEKVISERVANELGRGLSDKPVETPSGGENSNPVLLDIADSQATASDLAKSGVISELLDCFPVLVEFSQLSEESLLKILSQPNSSIIALFRRHFDMDKAELEFTSEALKTIAALAVKSKLGVRGLHAILRKTLQQPMFDVPGSDISKVQVTVDSGGKLTIAYSRRSSSSLDGRALFCVEPANVLGLKCLKRKALASTEDVAETVALDTCIAAYFESNMLLKHLTKKKAYYSFSDPFTLQGLRFQVRLNPHIENGNNYMACYVSCSSPQNEAFQVTADVKFSLWWPSDAVRIGTFHFSNSKPIQGFSMFVPWRNVPSTAVLQYRVKVYPCSNGNSSKSTGSDSDEEGNSVAQDIECCPPSKRSRKEEDCEGGHAERNDVHDESKGSYQTHGNAIVDGKEGVPHVPVDGKEGVPHVPVDGKEGVPHVPVDGREGVPHVPVDLPRSMVSSILETVCANCQEEIKSCSQCLNSALSVHLITHITADHLCSICKEDSV